jgi:hypothetical protein
MKGKTGFPGRRKAIVMGPQAITDSGQWAGNGLRFATKEEAETYVAELSGCGNDPVDGCP